MSKINLLSPLHGPFHSLWIGESKDNLARKIAGISKFKKDQVVLSKIVPNTPGSWSYDGLPQRQILKNSSGRVYFGKNVPVIRNNPEIAIPNGVRDLIEICSTGILDYSFQAALARRLHDFFEEWSRLTINFEPCTGDFFSNQFNRLHGKVKPISGHQGAMIEDDKWSPWELSIPVLHRRWAKPEDLFIRRIQNHIDLICRTASRGIDLSAGQIDRHHRVGKADAPFFKLLEQADSKAVLLQPKDRSHQFRHRIMKIENDSRAQNLWNQSTEDEHIRHVVDVNKVIAASEGSHGQGGEGDENENSVLREVAQFAAASPLHWDPIDLDAAERLTPRFLLVRLETDDIQLYALLGQSFRRPPWARIGGIMRKKENRAALSSKKSRLCYAGLARKSVGVDRGHGMRG